MGTYIYKNPYHVTSPFGAEESFRSDPHSGIDLSMDIGTQLRSIIDGEVLRVFSGNGDIGKGLIILGRDGKEYIYGHMQKVSLQIGDIVRFGTPLGTSGNSGNSTGPHLHFAVRENGEYIDPTKFKPDLDLTTGEMTAADFPIWDIEGRWTIAINNVIDSVTLRFKNMVVDALQAVVDFITEVSYSAALVGGAALIIARFIGFRKATPYFLLLQIVNVFIQMLLGGGVKWDDGSDLFESK